MRIELTTLFTEFFAFDVNEDFDESLIEECPTTFMDPDCDVDGINQKVMWVFGYDETESCAFVDDDIDQSFDLADPEEMLNFYPIMAEPINEVKLDPKSTGIVTAKTIESCDSLIELPENVSFANFEPNSFFCGQLDGSLVKAPGSLTEEVFEDFVKINGNMPYSKVFYIPFAERQKILEQMLGDYDISEEGIKEDIVSLIEDMRSYLESHPILTLDLVRQYRECESFEELDDLTLDTLIEERELDESDPMVFINDASLELQERFGDLLYECISNSSELFELIEPYLVEMEMEGTSGGNVEVSLNKI